MKSTTVRTQGRVAGSFGLDGVRQRAELDRKLKFTALLHHITATLLRESYYQLRKDAAAGVDDETWKDQSLRSPLKVAIIPTFRGIVCQVLIFGLKVPFLPFSAEICS